MKRFVIFLIVGVLAPSLTNAGTIYNVNRTIGAGTVIGFIETDGTLGVLTTANIIGGSITISHPNLDPDPSVIPFLGNSYKINGDALEATATELTYDFSLDVFSGTFFKVQDIFSSNLWCVIGPNVICGKNFPTDLGLTFPGGDYWTRQRPEPCREGRA